MISTVELTGEKIIAMLKENLGRAFARDPYDQMGGYVKRSLGFNVYIKIENPPGQSIDALRAYLARHRPLRTDLRGTFITVQDRGHL